MWIPIPHEPNCHAHAAANGRTPRPRCRTLAGSSRSGRTRRLPALQGDGSGWLGRLCTYRPSEPAVLSQLYGDLLQQSGSSTTRPHISPLGSILFLSTLGSDGRTCDVRTGARRSSSGPDEPFRRSSRRRRRAVHDPCGGDGRMAATIRHPNGWSAFVPGQNGWVRRSRASRDMLDVNIQRRRRESGNPHQERRRDRRRSARRPQDDVAGDP